MSRSGTASVATSRDGTGGVMKHASTRALFDYWNTQRGHRAAPERADIDPAAIRHALGDTFMLAADFVDQLRFRLAGTRVCALFGREIKGEGFTALWSEASRETHRRAARHRDQRENRRGRRRHRAHRRRRRDRPRNAAAAACPYPAKAAFARSACWRRWCRLIGWAQGGRASSSSGRCVTSGRGPPRTPASRCRKPDPIRIRHGLWSTAAAAKVPPEKSSANAPLTIEP